MSTEFKSRTTSALRVRLRNHSIPGTAACVVLLLVASGAEAEPFLAAPSLSFETGVGAFSIVACDLNGDGYLDLVTANPTESPDPGSVSVLLSDGLGSFLSKTDYPMTVTRPLALGDLNSDGHPDLIAARADSIVVLLGIGDGTLSPALIQAAGGGASDFALADLNHDGHEDIAMSAGGGRVGGMNILLGKGDGTFAPPRNYPTGGYATTVAAGDLNGDGEIDLVVGQGLSVVLLMLGRGDGTFMAPQVLTDQIWAPSLGLADLNSDGRLDLIVVNTDGSSHNQAFVLLGNGDGTFRSALMYGAGDETYGYGGFAIGDLNGDGRIDLAVPDFGRSEVAVVPGIGDGGFGPVQRFTVGSNPLSTVIGDFNGDGHPDIASACPVYNSLGMVSILLGNGDGTFGVDTRVTTGTQPSTVEVQDFNGDGYPDIASANFGSATVSVAINQGLGRFGASNNYAVGPYPASITSAKLDRARGLDLVVADYGTDLISILPGRGDGTFGSQVTVSTFPNPNVVAAADLNEDGRPDLIAASGDGTYICFFARSRPASKLGGTDPPGISIQLGLGQGVFGPRTEIPLGRYPSSLSVGDFNGDGNADLVVADPLARQVWLLIGTGSGAFGPPATVLERIPANMVLVRDLDRDGRLDLIVAYKDPCDLKGGVAVLKGYGDGTFSTRTDYPTPGGSYGVALADLHGNGNFDLVTANGTNTVSIFLGARDGTFVSRADFGTILSPYTVAVGDLDGDGRRDLVVGSLSGS